MKIQRDDTERDDSLSVFGHEVIIADESDGLAKWDFSVSIY